ncbi:RmlC-like cupin domain-containing protein [Cristinia sonorae]|uniref:RmlC-like cupin domain-containing protein n=1 Tax=Cristinia sonorae TaxID=1940300 RepID=A0A8K0UST8_9AGAR|nr:RmlC-like cupin domain-containing protein [Cristinia sonorae]
MTLTVTSAMIPSQYSSYAIPNDVLINQLDLRKHIEGGYYAETDRQSEVIRSPFADEALRPLATTIYYLLTYDYPDGLFHMNKSATMHVLHQGRVEYTLITPGVNGGPPTVEVKVMGHNIHAGEVLQLHVGSNIWKKSRLLPEDVAQARLDPSKQQHTGCLITEVVFPGFHWEDHQFLTKSTLKALWNVGSPEWKRWVRYVKED